MEKRDFTVDDVGLPKGQCFECDQSKFEYKTDSWYCKAKRESGECEFTPIPQYKIVKGDPV